jgi:hypothetical protein
MARKTAGDMVETLETEISVRLKNDWEIWLSEGPAKGLSRQHKKSRVATGWIPSAKYQVDDISEEAEVEDTDANLSWDSHQKAGTEVAADVALGSVNQELNSQVHAWSGEWACRPDSPSMPPI